MSDISGNVSFEHPSAHDDLVVWFDGRLDNRRELCEAIPGLVADDCTADASLVVATYRAYGDDCASRLAGDFAFALFDPRCRKLLLSRDIMAARPLYYASIRGGLAFASEARRLRAHPEVGTQLDADGLADLVLNGYSDGRRTCFTGVESVPPGAIVVATPEQVTVRQAWDFEDREIRYRDASEYVEHFRALFVQAVARRLRSPHPVAISVSGGVDSSAIYCEAARLRAASALHAVRYAFPEGSAADETRFVAALRTCGLPVDDIRIDRVTWSVDPESATDDMPSLSWVEQDALLARARDAGCRVMLNGFFGDQLFTGDAYLVDLVRRGRLGAIHADLRGRAAWMTDVDPALLRRRFARALLRAATPTAMLPAIRRVRGVPAEYPRWFTAHFRERAFEAALARAGRPRRFGRAHAEECRRLATSGHYLPGLSHVCSAGRKHGIETAYPFRDRDLVQFVMSIPGEVVNEGGVPKALLRRASEGRLPDAIRLRRCKGDGTPFTNAAARAAEPAIRRLLGPDAVAARAGILDPGALRQAMPAVFNDLAQSESAELGWGIGDTLALEVWLRRFFPGASWN